MLRRAPIKLFFKHAVAAEYQMFRIAVYPIQTVNKLSSSAIKLIKESKPFQPLCHSRQNYRTETTGMKKTRHNTELC